MLTKEQMIQFIKENYLTIPGKRMAKILGKSSTFVYLNMKKLGLIVPPDILQQFKKDSQIQKGNVPFNKGKKIEEYMTEDEILRFKENSYKKGNKPHNTHADGFISIRKTKKGEYYQIKINDKRIDLHRHIYSLKFGPIPRGYNIQFKDGNSLNVDPDNLFAISRFNQAFINNNGGYKIPFEYYETLKLIQSLKQKLNEKQAIRP